MKHYLVSLCALGLLLSGTVASAADCFSTKAEYDEIKSKLPDSMQNLPAVFTVDEGLGKGGIIVSQSGNGFRVKMKKLIMTNATESDQKVTSICLDRNRLRVSLEDRTSYILGIQGNSIIYENHRLVRSSIATYNRLLNTPSGFDGGYSNSMGAR